MASVLDVHAHMTDRAFADDLPSVLQRARAADVHHIISVSSNLDDARKLLRLAREYPTILPAIGLHPLHIAKLSHAEMSADLEQLCTLARDHADELVAIGEIGLDYMPVTLRGAVGNANEVKERMIDGMRAQVRLAKELGLPASVHSRAAGHYALSVVIGEVDTCMHAWDGRVQYALKAVDAGGVFFSVAPNVTRNVQLQKLVDKLDLRYLLVETDSPALSPVVGQRNEPANIGKAVQKIAMLKGLAADIVTRVLDDNSKRLFPRAFR